MNTGIVEFNSTIHAFVNQTQILNLNCVMVGATWFFRKQLSKHIR